MKKSLIYGLAIITLVLSLSLLANTTSVSAAYTPLAADLVKTATDPAVYYIGDDGKRHLYVNSVTFWTWYTGSWSDLKYDGVSKTLKTITQTDFDSLDSGSNITARPGVRLIKFQNSPKNYMVSATAQLALIPDTATAISMFGSNWATKVITIQNGFENDYTKDGVLDMTAGWKNYQNNDFNIKYPFYLSQKIKEDEQLPIISSIVSFIGTESGMNYESLLSITSMSNQGVVTIEDWANEVTSQSAWVNKGSVNISGQTAYILSLPESDVGNRYVFLSKNNMLIFDMTIQHFDQSTVNLIISSFALLK